MKPINIYLVRHGESLGNVDSAIYEKTPDWQIPLTQKGKKQAAVVCDKFWKKLEIEEWVQKAKKSVFYIKKPLIAIYCSPWYRARQTAAPFLDRIHTELPKVINPIGTAIEPFSPYSYKEDPRLREQEWGNFKEEPWSGKIGRERQKFGTFFYRMPFGESGADVFDRISTFNETLHRDFKKAEFPENMVIFSHGLTIRIFLMRWLHWTVEKFQNIRNPSNGQIIHMQLEKDKYVLKSKLRKRDPDFTQNFPWQIE